jgi:hypothetical protein
MHTNGDEIACKTYKQEPARLPVSHRSGTAIQINMYPMDVRHVEETLPHQMRVWHHQADSVIVTLDVQRSRTGRYRGTQYEENLQRIRQVLAEQTAKYPKIRVIETDYSPAAISAVARYFFGTDSMPTKAWDGGPFYTYFYGMYSTGARYVLHFDGDLLFGGSNRTWMAEAIELMEQRPEILLTSPYPGPARPDGEIYGHRSSDGFYHAREPLSSLAYRFNYVSSRSFLIDLTRFEERLGKLPQIRPTLKQRLKAMLLGNPPDALEAEMLLSFTLARSGMLRIDFLGAPSGCYTLHPQYRSQEFYRRLPELIAAVEHDTVPEGQWGHYDINDSFVDLSDAKAAVAWHRRYLRHIRHRLSSA